MGSNIKDEIKELRIAIMISRIGPIDFIPKIRENICAKKPRNIAIPRLSEKDAYMFSKTKSLNRNTGFISPIWSMVLRREPKAVPIFPLMSVIAGTRIKRPGRRTSSFSIPFSNIPVKPSPMDVKRRIGNT